MATSDSCLVIFHADDGENWANYLSAKLSGPDYGIRAVAKNLSTISSWNEKLYGSSIGSNNSSTSSLGLRDSGRGSRTIGDLPLDYEAVDTSKVYVFLLSPDVLSAETFPLNISQLHPKRSVFLFLGVEIEDVRAYFGELSECLFRCRMCVIHGDDKSVSDAMVEIIEAYEDNANSSIGEDIETIYETPPSPRQLNRIEKVLPREMNMSQDDHDVYFLLERPAEDELVVVLESSQDELPVICICERLYKFSLPESASGDIDFKVECQSHCIGEGSVLALTRLEKLRSILDEEVNPLAVIARAMGLASDDIDNVDAALASKLQQLSSLSTFQQLFPCEEALNNSLIDERSESLYPTLLHFAADWNLKKFCSELLNYPGMLAAAMTENKNGDNPVNLANNKDFYDLEAQLIEFLQVHKPEHDIYIPLSAPVAGPPRPHTTVISPGYVNVPNSSKTDSGLYMPMTSVADFRKPGPSTSISQSSDTDAISLVSSSSVFGDRGNQRDVDEQFLTGLDFDETFPSTPTTNQKKALKVLGVNEEDIKREKASTLNNRMNARSDYPANKPLDRAMIPHGVRFPAASHMSCHMGRVTNSSNDDEAHKNQKLKYKVAAFFGKSKSKRSASEGDNRFDLAARGVKKTPSTKSDKSKKKSSEVNNQDRDSGSYSDEENEPKGAKKSNKPREFKMREKPLTRQRPMSRRVQIASQERVKDAPDVPNTKTRKGAFTSFIDNF